MEWTSIIGDWRLLSFYSEELETGKRIYPLGETPKGYLIYTREGRMMALLVSSDRKALQKDEDRFELHKTMYAYSGRYTVEEDRVIHHVDTSWNEAWSGGDQIRFAALDGSRLTFKSPSQPSPHTGRLVASVVEWERESERIFLCDRYLAWEAKRELQKRSSRTHASGRVSVNSPADGVYQCLSRVIRKSRRIQSANLQKRCAA